MGSFKFREADELVSALQNDVEGIISKLQGEEVEEKDTGVPVCFSGSERDWYWLRNVGRDTISRVEVYNNGLCFYGDNGYESMVFIVGLMDKLDEKMEGNRRGLRRLLNLIDE